MKIPNSTNRIKQRHLRVPGTHFLNIQVKCAEQMIWFPRCVVHDCGGCKERILSWIWIANKMLDAKVVVCWELCEAYLINLPGSNDRSHLFTSSIKVARSAQQNWEKTKTKLMAINLHKSLVKGTVSDAHTFWFLHTYAHIQHTFTDFR